MEIDVAILVALAAQVGWLKWELRRLKSLLSELPCNRSRPSSGAASSKGSPALSVCAVSEVSEDG